MEEEAGLNCKGLFPIKGHLQQKEGDTSWVNKHTTGAGG